MIESIPKCAMAALLLASIPTAPDPNLWAQWGLAGLVVSFTLWRDHARERRMSESLEKHEEWVRSRLLSALERNSLAIERLLGTASLSARGGDLHA